MYFRYISHQIPDQRKNKKIETVDRQQYASMCMFRLNSQVRRRGCFTPGETSFRPVAKITDFGRWPTRILEIL